MSRQVVLITGGSQGIGAACADAFLNKKFYVSVLDLKRPGRPETPGFLFTQGDVADPDSRTHAVSRTLAEFGRIDVLLNCAGVGLYSTLANTPMDLAARVFDVNVMGRLGMAQAVIPVMRAQGCGSIVNIGSIGGLVTLPWSSVYCASKYASRALGEGLSRELKPDGIHVMTVICGIVATKFRSNVLAGLAPPRVTTMRALTPEKVAAVVMRGLQRRRRIIWIPWQGYVFDLLNRFFPGLIDTYCAMQQRGWNDLETEGSGTAQTKQPGGAGSILKPRIVLPGD